MLTIQLTDAEAQILINLLDLATKAGGLEVAQDSLVIADKVMQEVKVKKQKEENNGDPT